MGTGSRARSCAILLVDMVDYTPKWVSQTPEQNEKMMETFDELTRPVIEERGRVFKEVGDALFAVFETASDAALTARQIQTNFEDYNAHLGRDQGSIEVHESISMGDVTEKAGDVFGKPVIRAARMQKIARPGGAVFDSSIREAVSREEDLGLYYTVGRRHLKGLPGETTIHVMGKEDVQYLGVDEDIIPGVNWFKAPRKDIAASVYSRGIRLATESVDLVGISLFETLNRQPGWREIAARVADGIRFRLAILDPLSDARNALQLTASDFGYEEDRLTQETLDSIMFMPKIAKQVVMQQTPSGSIELRLSRVVPSLSYQMVDGQSLVIGLYFAHESGLNSPAAEVIDADLLRECRKHFDAIWGRGEKVFVHVGRDTYVDKTAEICKRSAS